MKIEIGKMSKEDAQKALSIATSAIETAIAQERENRGSQDKVNDLTESWNALVMMSAATEDDRRVQ